MIDFQKTQQSFTDLGIQNAEHFFSHSGHNKLLDDFEKGDITSAQFRDGIRKITNKPELTDVEIDHAWNSLLVGVPPINHQLLLKAKQQYRTFLLSNINEIHLNYIENYLKREHQVTSNDEFFEKIYYSHLVKKRKPDTAIFEHVVKDSKLNVSETLFIDDSPQHLKTAAQMGFHTHLMTKDDSLEKYLYRSGLLT